MDRLAFIFLEPSSSLKVNLRLFGPMSLLMSFSKNQFHSSFIAWHWGVGREGAALVTFCPGGTRVGPSSSHLRLSGGRLLAPAPGTPLLWFLSWCYAPCPEFCLTSCVPFLRPGGLERKLCSWTSENLGYKLLPFLWAPWPWVCVAARNMRSHLASSVRGVPSVPAAVAPVLPEAPSRWLPYATSPSRIICHCPWGCL